MRGSLEIHVNYDRRISLEEICDTIDRLREKYPGAKIIVDLSVGVHYGRKQ